MPKERGIRPPHITTCYFLSGYLDKEARASEFFLDGAWTHRVVSFLVDARLVPVISTGY